MHAQRAVIANPENALAYQALALAYFHNREFADFRIAADRALELNPGHSDVLADIGLCFGNLGVWEPALRLTSRAIELSPVHPGWHRWPSGWYHLVNDDPQAAMCEFTKGAMPGFFWYHVYVAGLCALLGEKDKAASEIRQLLQIYPDFARRARRECEIMCR